MTFIEKLYKKYQHMLNAMYKIEEYYKGNTDSLTNFTPTEGRSNLKVKANFMKKIIDEEVMYSFGNDITYVSKNDNNESLKLINLHNNSIKEDHNINLSTELIKFGSAYEISYISKAGTLKHKIVSPLSGICHFDEEDELDYFMHCYSVDESEYIDLYSASDIKTFDNKFNLIKTTPHIFGFVPVGIGKISVYDDETATIYKSIKTLQDALETNLSDISCELSDFRNAILKTYGLELFDENGKALAPIKRNNCILDFADKNSGEDAEWLTKQVDSAFIDSVINRELDLIYVLTDHINFNEELQSNLSGVALRSRLLSLEMKCRRNEKALTNIIKTRLKCLSKLCFLKNAGIIDINDIEIKFTPNVPQDIVTLAQVISQIPDAVLSRETKRSLLPFVSNLEVEANKVNKERKEDINIYGADLDKEVVNE